MPYNPMSRVSAPFFAWCAHKEPFDPARHLVRDIDGPMIIAHAENGFRSARVDVVAGKAGAPAANRRWCHISVLVDGQPRHLFYGEVVKSPIARRGQKVTIEFQSRLLGEDDDTQTANLLSGIIAAGNEGRSQLYVPQVQEASSPTDTDTLLKALTRTIEYTKDGVVVLCPGFGDPNKLRVIEDDAYSAESHGQDTDIIPPRGVLVVLSLDWIERRFIREDIGPLISREWAKVSASDPRYLDLLAREGIDLRMAANRDAAIQAILDSGGLDKYTFTPDSIRDALPKRDDVVGSNFYVTNSGFYFTDGPGAEPKSRSLHPSADVLTPIQKATGRPKDKAKRDSTSGVQMAKLESTGFSDWYLTIEGVASRQRREVWSIYVPNGCQDVVAGNNPAYIIPLSASDLTTDERTPEHKPETDYAAGDRVQQSGMTWQCTLPHKSTTNLFADIVEDDIFRENFGQTQWIPITENKSAFGRTDVQRSVDTPFGRVVVGHAIRRGIVDLSWKTRIQTETVTTTIDRAFDLDPTWTVRLMGDDYAGGSIEGKVTNIEFAFTGDDGDGRATITVDCAAGTGDPNDKTPPSPGSGTGEDEEDGSGDQDDKPLINGIDPPAVLIDPHAIDWSTTDPINYYDIDFTLLSEEESYDYFGTIDYERLYFDYDRDGLHDDDDPDANGDGIEDGQGSDPDDDDDDDETPDPDTEYRAATEGGAWDLVKYRLPFYVVADMASSSLAKVRIQWTGVEQQLALENPSGFKLDGSYSEGEVVRGYQFVGGQDDDAFLEQEASTKIDLIFPDGGVEGGKTETLSIVTTPWHGPKQVDLGDYEDDGE